MRVVRGGCREAERDFLRIFGGLARDLVDGCGGAIFGGGHGHYCADCVA